MNGARFRGSELLSKIDAECLLRLKSVDNLVNQTIKPDGEGRLEINWHLTAFDRVIHYPSASSALSALSKQSFSNCIFRGQTSSYCYRSQPIFGTSNTKVRCVIHSDSLLPTYFRRFERGGNISWTRYLRTQYGYEFGISSFYNIISAISKRGTNDHRMFVAELLERASNTMQISKLLSVNVRNGFWIGTNMIAEENWFDTANKQVAVSHWLAELNSICQHYGGRSLMTDFSWSPEVAMAFALDSDKEGESVIYSIDHEKFQRYLQEQIRESNVSKLSTSETLDYVGPIGLVDISRTAKSVALRPSAQQGVSFYGLEHFTTYALLISSESIIAHKFPRSKLDSRSLPQVYPENDPAEFFKYHSAVTMSHKVKRRHDWTSVLNRLGLHKEVHDSIGNLIKWERKPPREKLNCANKRCSCWLRIMIEIAEDSKNILDFETYQRTCDEINKTLDWMTKNPYKGSKKQRDDGQYASTDDILALLDRAKMLGPL
ncbi:MAG: FRG domain-containing protein [Fimbriimonadaceae bacterium]|nr:MAG: FRG domain-containing protein [Fimbriimonadaceae bacterium]